MALAPVQNAAMDHLLWKGVFGGACENLKGSLQSFDSNRRSKPLSPIGFGSRIKQLAERQLLPGERLPADSKIEQLFRKVFRVEFLKAIESKMIEVKEQLLSFDFYDQPSSTPFLHQYKLNKAQEAVSMETIAGGFELVNYKGIALKENFKVLQIWKDDFDRLIDQNLSDRMLSAFKKYWEMKAAAPDEKSQ